MKSYFHFALSMLLIFELFFYIATLGYVPSINQIAALGYVSRTNHIIAFEYIAPITAFGYCFIVNNVMEHGAVHKE